jgi:hypothetical protein
MGEAKSLRTQTAKRAARMGELGQGYTVRDRRMVVRGRAKAAPYRSGLRGTLPPSAPMAAALGRSSLFVLGHTRYAIRAPRSVRDEAMIRKALVATRLGSQPARSCQNSSLFFATLKNLRICRQLWDRLRPLITWTKSTSVDRGLQCTTACSRRYSAS